MKRKGTGGEGTAKSLLIATIEINVAFHHLRPLELTASPANGIRIHSLFGLC